MYRCKRLAKRGFTFSGPSYQCMSFQTYTDSILPLCGCRNLSLEHVANYFSFLPTSTASEVRVATLAFFPRSLSDICWRLGRINETRLETDETERLSLSLCLLLSLPTLSFTICNVLYCSDQITLPSLFGSPYCDYKKTPKTEPSILFSSCLYVL